MKLYARFVQLPRSTGYQGTNYEFQPTRLNLASLRPYTLTDETGCLLFSKRIELETWIEREGWTPVKAYADPEVKNGFVVELEKGTTKPTTPGIHRLTIPAEGLTLEQTRVAWKTTVYKNHKGIDFEYELVDGVVVSKQVTA